MNRDLSKFEPPKTQPDGLTKQLFGMPKITCAVCGSPKVRGHYRSGTWSIECPDCGVSIERPDVCDDTELENEVDILNSYEKLRYRVNKSKEEANGIHED